MHIVLRNEETGETEGIVCVNRASQTCTVLQADIERLDELVRLALAMKVPRVLLFVPPASVAELESYGWTRVTDLVLLSKQKGDVTDGQGSSCSV